MGRKFCITASVVAVLITVGGFFWWSRNFWLLDALFLRSTVAAGLLGALAVGVVQLLEPKRFSLRTLLIATTLLAALLGLGVWISR